MSSSILNIYFRQSILNIDSEKIIEQLNNSESKFSSKSQKQYDNERNKKIIG